MPRKRFLPVIPFASVGEVRRATNGKLYLVVRVDGAKAWLKHANRDGTVGPGRPCFGTMEGNPSDTSVEIAGSSKMAGKVSTKRLIEVDIL